MKCRRCGATLPRYGRICPECGLAVACVQRAGIMRCRRCGRRVEATGSLCPACGAPLRRSWRWAAYLVLALVVFAGGYYLFTVVVPVPDLLPKLQALGKASLASLLPAPTATFMPTRVGPTEARPTPSRIPTITPYRSPTPTMTATATATATRKSASPTRPPVVTPTASPGAPAVTETPAS